ncbi:MAG: UbiA family prenyltransferase [Armatimonadetes bacterium]|nr:UbiA family prenyltransferase [Armatimonadota bacterium]
MRSFAADLRGFLTDIRLEHSLFALPFALIGALLACQAGLYAGTRLLPYPSRHELLYLVVAMVAARSAAMGFNRVVDRHIDARNPRTAGRSLAAGRARVVTYWVLIAGGSALTWLVAGRFNALAQRCAPFALGVLFFYSLTKRFTALCHFFLGLALAISPLAAWVALCGKLPAAWPPYLLSAAVLLWVAGFDVLYATLDLEFDRRERLHSIPAALGLHRALWAARLCHLGTALCLLAFYAATSGLGVGFGLATLLSLGLLAYQHLLVRADDLGRVNAAFFTVNAVLGLILLVGAVLDWVL